MSREVPGSAAPAAAGRRFHLWGGARPDRAAAGLGGAGRPRSDSRAAAAGQL